MEANQKINCTVASYQFNQNQNDYDVSYLKNVVDFKLLEQKCKELKK